MRKPVFYMDEKKMNYYSDNIDDIAKSIYINQENRKIINNNLLKIGDDYKKTYDYLVKIVRPPIFHMFRRDKTRYGEKFIKQIGRGFMATLDDIKVALRVNVIDSSVEEISRKLLSVVDVGFRITKETNTPANVVLNAMVFGYTMVNDWQVYLATPSGIMMLNSVINDPLKNYDTFEDIMINASIVGVNITDVFNQLPYMGIELPVELLGKFSTLEAFVLTKGYKMLQMKNIKDLRQNIREF